MSQAGPADWARCWCAALLCRERGEHLEQLAPQITTHPIGHRGEPEDIAYGVLYLASDESKFVLGSELVIDGGYLM